MDKYAALHAFYESHKNIEFEWGKSDCALLAADWLKSCTGQDYAADFRGRYKTYLGSKRILSKLGHQSLANAVGAQLGEPLKAPLLAQRGDIVIVDTNVGDAVGIVDGLGVLVQGCEGIERVEISDAYLAWRVR